MFSLLDFHILHTSDFSVVASANCIDPTMLSVLCYHVLCFYFSSSFWNLSWLLCKKCCSHLSGSNTMLDTNTRYLFYSLYNLHSPNLFLYNLNLIWNILGECSNLLSAIWGAANSKFNWSKNQGASWTSCSFPGRCPFQPTYARIPRSCGTPSSSNSANPWHASWIPSSTLDARS